MSEVEELRAEVKRLREEAWQHALANDGCVPAPAYRDLGSEANRLEAERDLLAQAMWDARKALGFDNDGNDGPRSSIAGMGYEWFAAEHVREAEGFRADYEEALDFVPLTFTISGAREVPVAPKGRTP